MRSAHDDANADSATTRDRADPPTPPPEVSHTNAIINSMNLSLPTEALDIITQRLADANAGFRRRYPGGAVERQPVHSVYGGAHLFKAGGHMRLGGIALASMDEHAPDFDTFARALGFH